MSHRTVQSIVEGDSLPHEIIPEPIAHHKAGRLSMEKFSRSYKLADINKAIEDAHTGKCIKVVLIMD